MNKLEKYIKDNYLSGSILKNKTWSFFQRRPEEKTFVLEKTIKDSLTKLQELFPESKTDYYKEIYRISNSDILNCPEPTLFFEFGEEVLIGNLVNCVIIEKLYNGKYYMVEHGKNALGRHFFCVEWYHINKKSSLKSEKIFKKDDLRLSYYQTSLSSLISRVFHFGVDFNPDFQRGHVWTEKNKIELIDSIFSNYGIGNFCFNHLGYSGDKSYEIVDGKQRLTTIIDFVTNKIKYKGKFWYEFHPSDKWRFKEKTVSVADLSESNKKTIYKYFLKMNVGGIKQDKKHIEYVKKLLKGV